MYHIHTRTDNYVCVLTGEQKLVGRSSKRRNSTAESEKLSKRSKVKKEVSMCAVGEVVDLTDD